MRKNTPNKYVVVNDGESVVVKNGCDKYITKTLIRQVYFPEGQEVCRMCPFCVADPSNHKRERCEITGEILPFAELKIDNRCPLIEE